MKKVFILMAVVAMCFTACAQKQKGEQRGPRHGRAMEHMASFDYGYKIAAVRDWLFKQQK